MSQRLSPLMHRLAALALLFGVVGAGFALLVLPLIGHFSDLRAEIGRQRELLGRFEAFAANKDSAEAVAEQAKAAMQGGLFLSGETDALRTANLQALVTDVAAKNGIRLSSTRALPVQEQGGLRLIGVQAEFEADLKQLQAITAAVEARRPVLFVQSMQIAPLNSARRDNGELKVRFGLFGAVAAPGEAKP
jgi:hypothetical protein